jgi:ketosteroid isomerase-like protein
VDRLDELVARDQIRDLAVRYALAVDGKDVDGLAALFVEDVDNGRYGSGREGVKTFYDKVLREFHCSMHLVANHVIDFDDGDHAHGVVYCRAQHHVLEPEHWFDHALAYWDVYERVADGWRFRRRSLKSWYRQDFGHPDRGTERVASDAATEGPMRGTQMPEAFATFDEFWSRPARPLPTPPG